MPDSKSLIHLSTDLATMFLESTDTDCELVTSSGDHLPVHSVLLKARSSYFRALLSSRWTVAGRETRLGVGTEALTMIVTFLYSGQVQLEGVEVELLFEVLDNARMMRITDLEKELEDFIVGDLLAKSNSDETKMVFTVLNEGVAHQFLDITRACLAVSQDLLESSAMELPDGNFWQLEKGVWTELHLLTPQSLAALLHILPLQHVAWLIAFCLHEGFWKGAEVEVFEEIGPEISREALELLEVKALVEILRFAGNQELGARVGQVLVTKEERLRKKNSKLKKEVEVERKAKEAEVKRSEQLKAGSRAKDQRILSLQRFVDEMSGALQNASLSSSFKP